MRHSATKAGAASARTEHDLEGLLDYLKRSRGFDFTGYRRPGIARRILKRMHSVGVESYPDYIDFLEVHPEEFAQLFNTILINVTHFFRDESAWEYLKTEVLPALLTRLGNGAHLRVWSAGCASGEEAYTMAMILAEIMGQEAFKERVKIYATDIDEEALARARVGSYTEREVEGVPKELLERYFDRIDSHYTFRKDLRRQVIFGRHDLIQDAPISRVDVLTCRNALMYFNSETQTRILARFHFALNDNGVLFLGRAESLLTHASTFAPVDLKRRIFTKVPRANLNLRDRLLLITQTGGEDGTAATQHLRLREAAVDSSPVAQIVVDTAGTVVLVNERARGLFGLANDDVGRPLQDLKLSYRPVELRSLIEQAAIDRRPFVMRDVGWPADNGEARWFDLQIVPMIEPGGTILGSSVAFSDVTVAKRLQNDLERTNQELEAAYEELQSTNEELETTNEELQSTIEELETTNEELQSTNEELETMNEELQSTNEELSAMNDELRQRSDELNQVNDLLESILSTLPGGVVVLNPELHVLLWSSHAMELWGLREDEVAGKSFFGLDIGLPVEKLKQPVRACMTGQKDTTEILLDARNRRGKAIRCRITCSRLVAPHHPTLGALLVMEELPKELKVKE